MRVALLGQHRIRVFALFAPVLRVGSATLWSRSSNRPLDGIGPTLRGRREDPRSIDSLARAVVGPLDEESLPPTRLQPPKSKFVKLFPPAILALGGILTVLWNVGWIWLLLRLT